MWHLKLRVRIIKLVCAKESGAPAMAVRYYARDDRGNAMRMHNSSGRPPEFASIWRWRLKCHDATWKPRAKWWSNWSLMKRFGVTSTSFLPPRETLSAFKSHVRLIFPRPFLCCFRSARGLPVKTRSNVTSGNSHHPWVTSSYEAPSAHFFLPFFIFFLILFNSLEVI